MGWKSRKKIVPPSIPFLLFKLPFLKLFELFMTALFFPQYKMKQLRSNLNQFKLSILLGCFKFEKRVISLALEVQIIFYLQKPPKSSDNIMKNQHNSRNNPEKRGK